MSNVKYSISAPVSSSPTHFVTTWSPAPLVTGKRVAVYFYSPGNGETQKVHGATTDKWADGACYHYTGGGACSGISDIYFAMTEVIRTISAHRLLHSFRHIPQPLSLRLSRYLDHITSIVILPLLRQVY